MGQYRAKAWNNACRLAWLNGRRKSSSACHERVWLRRSAHLNLSRQISRQMQQAVLSGVTGKLLIKLKMMGLGEKHKSGAEAVPLDRGRSRLDRICHWSFSGINTGIDLVYSLHE